MSFHFCYFQAHLFDFSMIKKKILFQLSLSLVFVADTLFDIWYLFLKLKLIYHIDAKFFLVLLSNLLTFIDSLCQSDNFALYISHDIDQLIVFVLLLIINRFFLFPNTFNSSFLVFQLPSFSINFFKFSFFTQQLSLHLYLTIDISFLHFEQQLLIVWNRLQKHLYVFVHKTCLFLVLRVLVITFIVSVEKHA